MNKKLSLIAGVIGILIFFFLALNSLINDSPTFDEQFYASSGLSYLRSGDPRLNYLHPPFVNLLIALPLLSVPELELPFDHWSWELYTGNLSISSFSDELFWNNKNPLDIQKIFFLARMPGVLLTIFLAAVGWRFAREFWGHLSPLVVFSLLLFDPNILAHGRYATTDVGSTLFVFLVTYFLWRLWQKERWDWTRWLATAVALGIAFSTKYSTLLFLPIWALQAMLPIYGKATQTPYRKQILKIWSRLVQLASAAIVAFFILWASYSFEWREYAFRYTRLQAFNGFSGPLPTYFAGLIRHLALSKQGLPAFLFGEISSHGFPFYFPLAFLVKTPILTLTLFISAVIILIILSKTRGKAIFLLIPVIISMISLSQNRINIGYRHLLPILPFVFMLIAGLCSSSFKAYLQALPNAARGRWQTKRLGQSPYFILGIVILYLFAGVIWIHPYYLSYFNTLVGGPNNGYRILVDSNIDWGQDLMRLKTWAGENEVSDLKLSWFGSSDPDYYDLEYEPLPGWPRNINLWKNPPFNPKDPEAGTYAISVTNLWGVWMNNSDLYAWFRNREPDDRIGYSINIYEVP